MLERLLETVMRGGKAGPRDLRDALAAYLALVGGVTIERSVGQLRGAFAGRLSTYERPSVADLAAVRAWIEREHPGRPAHARVRLLLDEMGLQATVRERLQVLGKPRRRRFAVMEGGRESSPPRGQLTLVRAETMPAEPTPGAGAQ